MNINRHNYEEYFILYWDNELAAEQKQVVEDFVKENPDLRNEFNIFGETKFSPDNSIQFQEKDLLLNNDSFINITNYEEQLLSFIDDELSPEQNQEVEKFIAAYPAAHKELVLLQKVRLQPEEEISFPDKSVLYRRDEKVMVIKMSWLRVAVAALLILVGGFVTFRLIINKTHEQINIAGREESTKQPVNQPANDQPANIASNDKNSSSSPQTQDKKVVEKETQKNLHENLVADNTTTTKKPENKNNLPSPKQNTDQSLIAQVDVPQDITSESTLQPSEDLRSNSVSIVDQDIKNNLNNKSVVTDKATPTYTVYEHTDESDVDSKGGGLKEFLRKTTRAIERRTRLQTTTDDNKLLVGAFAVSLK